MTSIIFSKNRACQIDALLRSINDHCQLFKKIIVLYTTTSKDFTDGYEIAINKHPDIDWMAEVSFRNDFYLCLDNSDDKVCLLVDDDIFINPVDELTLFDMMMEVDIISLRLGDNVTKKQHLHFNYKGSLDGNIYNTHDLLGAIQGAGFNNPNRLESRLTHSLNDLSMAWFKESRLVGIPANRVSSTSGCDYFGHSSEELNELWLHGQEIDYNAMNLKGDNVHIYEPYKFRNRAN